MKKQGLLHVLLALGLLLLLAAGLGQAQGSVPEGVQPDAAVGTGFTYQGRLRDGGGSPISSACDFSFSLWDADAGGTQVGGDCAVSGVSVADGYFAALVNGGGEFGDSAFTGEAHWLQIAVRCTGDPGYTTLSPRQALTAAPYALGLRPGAVITGAVAGGSGLRVTNTTTSGTAYGLYGQADSEAGYGVYGLATATGGGDSAGVYGRSTGADGVGVAGSAAGEDGSGVVGRSSGNMGRGVVGEADATSSTTYGVYGWSRSSGGSGVYGYASASSGWTEGVYGLADSTDGAGVHGVASASSGSATGVQGESSSTAGYGVYGVASATTGTSYGLYGYSRSPNGYGVYGYVDANSGTSYGVYGESHSIAGRGVQGFADSVSGTTYGVYGRSESPDGCGVAGWGSAISGTAYGVYGRSDSPNGVAVYGRATAAYGDTFGVYGESVSTDGQGVYGYASAASGAAFGVYGQAESPDGRGVVGYASAASGENYGVYGSTASAEGYAGYFNGRLYAREPINATATPGNHVAQFYNTSTGSSPDVLALKVGYVADPDEGINFITFFHGSDIAVGAIEGDGAGGVTYKSGSADYAEYLPRRNPREDVGPGDVVGVYRGQVSRATRGADQVLVVSSAPLVLGNDPGGEDAAGYEKVAFLGQVAVRVRGPVAVGDLLVPSGLEDGTAIAVDRGEVTAEQFAQVLGQAWESSDEADVELVQAAVGLLRSDPTVSRMAQQIEDLEARIAALEVSGHSDTASTPLPLGGLLPGAGVVLAGLAVALCWPAGRRWLARRGGGR